MNRNLAWPVGGGLIFGVLTSIWAIYQADAAFRVRPRLHNVDFITALLTNHGHDWLFYYYPIPMAVFGTLFVTFAVVVAWKLA